MYYCPYCDSTNIRTKHLFFTCRSIDNCVFNKELIEEMEEEYPGEGKSLLCIQCDRSTSHITGYVCIDCGKIFCIPNEDVNCEEKIDKNKEYNASDCDENNDDDSDEEDDYDNDDNNGDD